MTDITIRPGTREDCGILYELLKEFLQLEQIIPDQKLDEKSLIRDGYGNEPVFETLIAEAKTKSGSSEVAGFALYCYHYSVFSGRSVFMEALYVKPDHQKKGIGKNLWKKIVKIGLDNGCSRCMFCAFGWNKNAVEFYKKCGAVDMTAENDDHVFHMNRESMIQFTSS